MNKLSQEKHEKESKQIQEFERTFFPNQLIENFLMDEFREL